MAESAFDRRLACMTRQAYIEERTLWERSRDRAAAPYKVNPRWDKVGKNGTAWDQIVRACRARGVDPVLYVRLTFRHWMQTKPPMPNHMVGKEVLQRFLAEDHLARRMEACEASFRSQMSILRLQLRAWSTLEWPGKTLSRFVLLNHSGIAASISPLLRYCIARREGLNDVAKVYEEEAMFQYSREKEFYAKVWKPVLPDDIDGIAAKCQKKSGAFIDEE